ncbi:S1C family serine protease [Tabrizicola sp.]|uniref:S1C family serine protease n=1 Tax=Tabrizicola sp. TaxID=2005166 RepID=UPI003F311C69
MAQSATALQSFSTDLSTLVATASRSVVGVHGHRSRHSGFAWRPGLVVTCEEALADEGPYELVLPGGARVSATLVGRDPTTDVAVLRYEGDDVPQPAFVTSTPVAGSLVAAVGSFEGAATAHLGVVSHASGPWRAMRGGEIDARIDLDLRLGKSAEGGLALDVAGQAFGMVVYGPRRRALVIPTATIERVADSLVKHGRIAHGYLGLSLWPTKVDGEDATGNIVVSVDPAGPGAVAGLHQGDVLVRWNDQPMRPIRQMMRELGPASVGTVVSLGLRRAGEARTVTLTIGERPDA